MEKNTVSKLTVSFGLSLAICSVINALLVIVKETSPAVQAEMKRLTGSHWVTHVAIVLLLFLAGGGLFAKVKNGLGVTLSVNGLIKTILGGIVAASVIIIGFYLFAD